MYMCINYIYNPATMREHYFYETLSAASCKVGEEGKEDKGSRVGAGWYGGRFGSTKYLAKFIRMICEVYQIAVIPWI